MASSVSSEHAFLEAGITIGKHRNWSKGDIVEAIQCLKCMYVNDLIFCEVSTLDMEEDELDADDGLLPSIAEGDKTHNVFSWDQLINDDSLNVDEWWFMF